MSQPRTPAYGDIPIGSIAARCCCLPNSPTEPCAGRWGHAVRSGALGSRWTPCRPHDPDIAKALCLYLNSTSPACCDGCWASAITACRHTRRSPWIRCARCRSAQLRSAGSPLSATYSNGWFAWLQNAYAAALPPKCTRTPARRQIDEVVTTALGLGPGSMGCHHTASWRIRNRRLLDAGQWITYPG